MVSDAQRKRLVDYATYLIHKEPLIHYKEIRPMPYLKLPTWESAHRHLEKGGSLTTDCSGSTTCLFKWAGLRDPNGLGYDGQGYTGTMLEHLGHYAQTSHAHPGALGVFGAGAGTHVVMLMERSGDDPWVFSHGQEAGPLRIRLSAERQAHAGQPFTWLNIAHL